MNKEIIIKFLGLRRSGNHLIIDWIGESMKDEYLHINDLSLDLVGRLGLRNVRGKLKEKFKNSLFDTISNFKTNILFCSFENLEFDSIFKNSELEKKFNKLFGLSKTSYNILILRDPFNIFASLLFSKRINQNNIEKYIKLWKNHAKNYLNCKKDNFIAINYNQFVSSKKYRDELAVKLNIESNEGILKKVAYNGSSFDGHKFNGNAQNMKISERWKNYIDDEFYKNIFKDNELVELSDKIFGKIPGTEIFFNSFSSRLSSFFKTLIPKNSSNMDIIRLKSNPIIKTDMKGLEKELGENINGPSIIRVPNWIKNPLGKYYLYFSHHKGKYIRMAYANSLEGPWKIYSKGTLQLTQTPCKDHIASPDVHMDEKNKEIKMYFHGKFKSKKGYPQATFLAISKDGLDFKSHNTLLGPFYFRVFYYDTKYYAIAKNKNKSGLILRSNDGYSEFEECTEIIPNIRHTAVFIKDKTLYLLYSKIKDKPERILLSKIDLSQDCSKWKPSKPIEIIKPGEKYEGADLPLIASRAGPVMKKVNQLRDPAIFLENDKVYLFYTIAGEKGIAVSEIKNLT